jgi:hypothetical protein
MDGDTSQFSDYIPLTGTGPGGSGSPGISPRLFGGLVSQSSTLLPVVPETPGTAGPDSRTIATPQSVRDWDLAFAGLQPPQPITLTSEWGFSDWDFWLSKDRALLENV